MRYKRKITTIGGSVGIVLPKEFLDFLGFELDDMVQIEDQKNETGENIIIIKKEK